MTGSMPWKFFFLQTVFFALLSWQIGQYSSKECSRLSAEGQARISAGLTELIRRLDQLEQKVGSTSREQAAQVVAIPSAAKEAGGSEEGLAQLVQRIEALEVQVETNSADLRKKEQAASALITQAQPEAVRVRNWMSSLDPETKEAVQAAYREQLDLMQEQIAVTPGAPAPSPETMAVMLQESREGLKQKLRSILNEAEYQAFLDSLDETELPIVPPPLSSQ
jgi:hypothetical protein